MAYGVLPETCPYNEGVACSTTDQCCKCGWNEEVAAERTNRILEEMGIKSNEK